MLGDIVRAVLAAVSILIVALTFVWPALAPDDAADPAYRWVATAALWIFLAALAAVLWDKACKARRT